MSVNIYDKNTGELTKVAGNSKDPNIEFPTTPAGKFLKDDNTWDNVPNPSVVTGATATTDGESGLVPQPLAGDQDKFLKGDGSFGNIPKANNDITNLAPAYDATLTYDVGDLVTFIDAQGSGKLYKCIVAVTTPEAFNINKWDDVTTSEVFAKKREIVSSVDFTATSTWGDVLNALTQNITIEEDTEYILEIETASYTSIERMRAAFSNAVIFVDTYSSATSILSRYINTGTNGTGGIVYTNKIDTNGFSHTDETSEPIAGESGSAKIIKFND